VHPEGRIAGGVPSRCLIGHAEAPDLARSRRLTHIHEHEDESHLSCHARAQVEDPEIVEAVAVRPVVPCLEMTQPSGIRRIRDVPDEYALAERRLGLSAPVGRDGFQRRRQQVASEGDLERPRAGRPGNEANALWRARVGDIEDRPAAVPEMTHVEEVSVGLDRQRELEPGPPVEAMVGNSLERSLGSSDPLPGGHHSPLPPRHSPGAARCPPTQILRSFAAVSPSIAARSASVRPGVPRMWSTDVFVHGYG
jgi:hypothetical protein